MTSPTDILRHTLRAGGEMVPMFLADLSPEQLLHRIHPTANCAAWVVGHLVLTERNFHKAIGVTAPAMPEDFQMLFARDQIAPRRAEYGDTARLLPAFEIHRAATIAALDTLPPGRLDEPSPRQSPRYSTLGELLNFAGLHTMMHVGQISYIRRHLGLPPLV